jgi:hypothetical protein
MRASIFAFLGLGLAACSATPEPSTPGVPHAHNPKAPDLALGEGDAYVKNPAVRLPLEYWIVLSTKDGAHALFPRPDGAPAIAAECAAQTEMGRSFEAAALCAPAQTEEAVRKVNGLSREQAMQVSSFLHERLEFRRVGEAIEPFPMTSDVLAVCRQIPALRGGAMKARCDEEERYALGGARPSIFRVWTEAELDALPPALNEIYGVGGVAAR